MADALNKISAYELFTIFFPGVLTVGYSLWILDIKILDGSKETKEQAELIKKTILEYLEKC